MASIDRQLDAGFRKVGKPVEGLDDFDVPMPASDDGQTASVAEFHLAGHHNQESHGSGGVGSVANKLKSGGTISLGAGETLARSDLVQQRGGGGALLAAVDSDDGARRVRLGVIGDESGISKWRAGNKGATAELTPAQARSIADGLTESSRRARSQNQEADAVIEVLEDMGWDPDDRNPPSEQRELLDRHDNLTSGLVGNVKTVETPWGDVVYGTRNTDSGPSVAIAVVSDDADADWTIDDAISDGTALDLTLAQVRALASKLRASAGEGQTAAVDYTEFAIPEQLADYWLHGKGAAKVRWCSRGSWRRARRLLRKYVPPAQLDGLVTNLYVRACGHGPRRGNEASFAEMDAPVVAPEDSPQIVGDDGDVSTYKRVDWNGPLAPVDIATGDRRRFAEGALSTRQLPLPFRWQEKAAQGHDGSVVVGALTGYDIAEDGTILGRGYFLDPDIIPDVRKAMHLVEHGVVGPSVDLEPDMDVVAADEAGEEFDPDACAEAGTCPDKPQALITRATIAGATLVPITAFAEARAPQLTEHGEFSLHEFCRTPLHPGPCKGWKGNSGSKTSTSKPKAKATPAPAKSEPAAKPKATSSTIKAVKPSVMDADWKDHNDSLSAEQRQAVHDYTTSDYFAINNALKGNPPKTARHRKALAQTTDLIRSSMAPSPRATKVFRGTNTASVGLSKNPTLAEMQALVGKNLVNEAFTSTSVSADEIFAGNLEFDIEMPEGTPSLWLNGNSRLPDEHEVLLDAGSKMQVLSVTESPAGSGNYKVKTRVVN
jgi:hypothetical protein